MNWWGKLIGGTLGFMIGGPIGALLGVVLGHGFDGQRAPRDWSGAAMGNNSRVQTVFFTTTFSVMGHLAKADGRVSESEIQMARNIMRHMNLKEDQVQAAIRLFNEGKQPDFPLDDILQQFRQECGRRLGLMQMFLEIQVQAAMADGVITPAERRILDRMCAVLGLPVSVIRQIEALIRMQQGRAGQQQYGGAGDAHSQAARRPDAVADAYGVLGVEPSAGDAEVKKAYRRLMSRHHPDKLAAKGLPEEMMRVAQEKAQEITRAYDIVKEARGMS